MHFRVVGMDCAEDAAEIESTAKAVGIDGAWVSTATQTLTVPRDASPEIVVRLTEAVTALGYRLLTQDREGEVIDRSYKRALWIVTVLNVGFGIVEMIGGFLSQSQSLKADSLDFVGDGLITFLGLVAIRWRAVWRARSALVQGLFLAALGLGVIAATVYRALNREPPEVGLMGGLGFAALAANITAALVLIPHRTGDANARAVWLFSRNDAIGNAAVIGAAGLVLWTGSAWPGLIVAFVIAGLFLSSARTIVRDSLKELRA